MSARVVKLPERGGGPEANEHSTPAVRHCPELAASGRCACATCTETFKVLARLQKQHHYVDDLTVRLSGESQQELERLRQRYSDRHALRLLEAARIIAGESMLDLENPVRAAIRALERIEQQREDKLAHARWLSNAQRNRNADKQAIANFRVWEQQAVVKGMDTAQRVKKYCRLQRIPDREKRRIRALLKARKII